MGVIPSRFSSPPFPSYLWFMNSKGLAKQQDYIAFLLVIVAVIWFDREMISTNLVPYFRDLGPLFYPMRFSLAESFKAGELPLWDRHTAMGFPLLANFQSGSFYPPNLVYLILPFFTALRAIFLSHYLIAATGGYLLCRRWSYPPYLALIGALLFTLGGTIVSLSNLLNHFQTAVWLPWVILLGERALLDPTRKKFLAFVLISTIQFLAGSPEFYAMSMGLFLLDGMRLKAEGEPLPYGRTLFLFLGANGLVACLAMIQILPTMELFLESRAPAPMDYSVASLYSLRPLSLIDVFFPNGEVDTSVFSGNRYFFRSDVPFMVSHYMGAVSLFGIVLWFFYGSWRERAILSGLTFVSLVVAMGIYTPVFSLLFHYIPPFRLFRFPEKVFFLSHAFLLFMALKGLYEFLEKDRALGWRLLVVLLSIPLLFIVPYLFLRSETLPLLRFVAQYAQTGTLAETLKNSSGVLYYLERQVGLLLGISLLLVLWKKGYLRTALFQPLIIALVFLDLTSANRPYRYLLDPEFVSHGNTIIQTRDPDHHRLFYYPGPSNLSPHYYANQERESFAELNSLITGNLLPNTGVFHGFDYMQELDAFVRWPYLNFLYVAKDLPPDRLYGLLGALNVKYLITLAPAPSGDLSLVRHAPEYPSWLYRINGSIPRAYVVSRAIEEKNPVEVIKRLSRSSFDPLKEVILEQPFPISTNGEFRSKAEIVAYAHQSVTINASLNGSGLLVLADSFYPGWRAYVDGKETKILRANLFFRAVPLSPGEHMVEFRYQPLSFTIGWVISLLTLVGIIFWYYFYDRVRFRLSV